MSVETLFIEFIILLIKNKGKYPLISIYYLFSLIFHYDR